VKALKRYSIPVAMSHVEMMKNIIETIVNNQRISGKCTNLTPSSVFLKRRVRAENQHVTRNKP
jgi:hypothetical protein